MFYKTKYKCIVGRDIAVLTYNSTTQDTKTGGLL